MNFHRYLDPSGFARELAPLQAFRGQYVGSALLETLESAGLLKPVMRVRYPDSVARRLWLDRHDERYKMSGELELDGERWSAIVSLENALFRWNHALAYGPSSHPLDAPSDDIKSFLEDPRMTPYRPWIEQRVDVSNDVHSKLFDDGNVKVFYSTWQLLLAADVADAGVQFRVNLADDQTWKATQDALRASKALDAVYSIPFAPIRAVLAFEKHRAALDAVVWYAEETARATSNILRFRRAARFSLTQQEAHEIDEAARIVVDQVRRMSVTSSEIVALARFLGERWIEWTDLGRPKIAEAYKSVMLQSVRLLGLLTECDFDTLRTEIGNVDGHEELVLDTIWPNWTAVEKSRALRTLRASFSSGHGVLLDDAHLSNFLDWLSSQGLEEFFWRLHSFEEHAFRSVGPQLAALRSDLQGLALAVEHITQALGATRGQLYENFKRLWSRHPTIHAALLSGPVRRLVTTRAMLDDWQALKSEIENLRQRPDGDVLADLVWAARLRGAVHYEIPEREQLELERLFVVLMRSAAFTFAEVTKGAR